MHFKKFKEIQKEQKAKEERTLALVSDQLAQLKEYHTIHMVETERICPGDTVKRQMSEQSLRALCDSITRYGMLEPLVVRRICPDESPLGGIFTLVSGYRRLEALKRLGVPKAPCIICQCKAPALLPALSACLLHKKELTAFECSDLLSHFQKQSAYSTEKLAQCLSLDENQVTTLLSYQNLEEDERALCISAELPSYLISELAKMPKNSNRKRWLVEIVHTLRTIFPEDRHSFPGDPPKEQRQRMLFSDIRPFYNSIEQMVARMRSAGISAITQQQETEDYYQLTLRIAKESKVRIMHDSRDLSKRSAP